jgi:hypothetical protein
LARFYFPVVGTKKMDKLKVESTTMKKWDATMGVLRHRRVDDLRTTGKFAQINCFKLLVALVSAQLFMMILAGVLFMPSADFAPPARNVSIGDFPNQHTWPQEHGKQDHSQSRQFKAFSDSRVEGNRAALEDYINGPDVPLDHQPAILILGGSDGSGTRSFVKHLIQLGVPMIYDDEITMDVHGRSMSDGDGWPQIVRMVLDSVHSANYNVSSLPDDVKEIALFHLTRLKKELTRKFENRFRDTAKVKTGILFGFKAPVTMLLLPILGEVFGTVKFLHVVRDGRDIALSANQSPVKKFYDFYYKDYIERRRKLERPVGEESLENVFGMQLWNDWNTEVLEWERTRAAGQSFDYMVMRTEDLVDPKHKLNSLLHLASFVGLRPSTSELCCMMIKEETDMGLSVNVSQRGRASLHDGFGELLTGERGPPALESDFSRVKVQETRAVKRERLRRERKIQTNNDDELGRSTGVVSDRRRLLGSGIATTSSEKVGESKAKDAVGTTGDPNLSGVRLRYGRWATTLRNQTDLSLKLHAEGALGLKTFGYEPAGRFQQQHPDLPHTRDYCQRQDPLECSS